MKFPAEIYQSSAKKFVGTPQDLTYPQMAARKVQQGGKISWGAQKIFISTALRGWSLGVESRHPQRCNVWFGRLLLGQLEPATGSFVRTEATPAVMEASQKVSPASDAGTEER